MIVRILIIIHLLSIPENNSIYKTVVLENFESSSFIKDNLQYPSEHYKKCRLETSDAFPSPENNSKRYIMLTLFGNHRDTATIIPPAIIKISNYCKSISLWAYGKNSPGIISIFLKDTSGEQHRIILGRLDFTGWKKLTADIPSNIAQMDECIDQKTYLALQKITIHPGTNDLSPRYSFIYIDDISAKVRIKYLNKDSKEW